MTDLCFRTVSVRSAPRRPLAAVTVGLFVAHCLWGGATHAAEAPAAKQATTAKGATTATDPSDPRNKKINALQEVTIQAQRTSDAVARLAQKQAFNIINLETYNEIKQLPDVTTAEAVERIPGISRETDEGEARYINIRGLDADLNSTTFDGVRLMPTNNASPFGGYRGVTLDSIPIGIVGAITVTDTNLPSQDAEALGGTINITPKTAPVGGKPFLEGRLGGGYEPLRGTPITDLQVSGGTRFGGSGTPTGGVSAYSDNPFSVVGTLAYYEDKRGIDDVEPAYINDPTKGPYNAINNLQQRDYELHRKRLGWGLDLGYQPDADAEYYVRAFQAGYNEKYTRPFFNLTPDGNPTVNASGQIVDTLTAPGAMQMAFRDEREINKEALYMAGGRNVFGGGQILDYRVAFTKGTWHKPYDYDSTFTYTPSQANATITYSPTGEGNTPLYTISGAPGYLNGANYQLSNFANSSAYNYDQEWSFASNFDMPLSLIGAADEDLQVGVSARLRKKLESYYQTSYPTLPAISLAQADGGRPPESYYDNQYMNPPDVLPGYLQSQLGSGTAQATDLLFNDSQYFLGKENVYAAYLQYHVQWDRFGVVGGARVENTHDDLGAYATVTNASGTTAVPVDTTHNYTNVFPGIQARYNISPSLVARASWSSTLARPGFNQLTPSALVDLGSGQITVGNPNLKPAYANSFDADIEKYLPHAGIVSLDVFDKEIRDYIVADLTGSQVTFFHGTNVPLRTFTYKNAPGNSYARGVMLNYQQDLTFLPGLLSGLGLSGNLTYIDSRFQIRPGEYARLPSSSKTTWNASVFYKKSRFLVRVAAYGVSADLFSIGSDYSSDVYNAKRTYLDLGSSYDLSEAWQIYFNVQNLLNTPHEFWEGSSNRPIQREFYGQTYQAGFRFNY